MAFNCSFQICRYAMNGAEGLTEVFSKAGVDKISVYDTTVMHDCSQGDNLILYIYFSSFIRLQSCLNTYFMIELCVD